MTTADDTDDMMHRADRLYAARSALAEAGTPVRTLGIAEIVGFLSDPRRSLSIDEQRSLFADPRLRADFRRLDSKSPLELPALAAASGSRRPGARFDGGSVIIHPSRVPGQIYVRIQFAIAGSAPRTMLLEAPGAEARQACASVSRRGRGNHVGAGRAQRRRCRLPGPDHRSDRDGRVPPLNAREKALPLSPGCSDRDARQLAKCLAICRGGGRRPKRMARPGRRRCVNLAETGQCSRWGSR